MRVVLAAAVLSLTLAVSGAAAAQRPAQLIVPGESIGPVRLGMTIAQVKRALGKPVALVRRIEHAFGGEYVELQWGQARWTVGLRSDRGTLRVVRIATTVNGQRTRDGIGPGSKPRAVLRAFPLSGCVFRDLQQPWPGTWLVAEKSDGSMTAFLLYGRLRFGEMRVNRFVVEVVVQERWYARPAGDGDCGADWRADFRRS